MTPEETRLALRANGYHPLPLLGKRPTFDGWQRLTETTAEQIRFWTRTRPAEENTGVLTITTPTFDIDIRDPDAAKAIEDLAREYFEEQGDILIRFGFWPKRAIPFRTDAPFDKITIIFDGEEKLEFLARGQQVVVAGVHPDTGRPYEWFGGALCEIERSRLPYIHAEQAQQLMEQAAQLLVDWFGYRLPAKPARKSGAGNGADQTGADWQTLVCNIRDGKALHDSIRDLAAKMVKSGMDGGAVVNQLRALMDASAAPRDARWQERYDDIPRAVATAEQFRETEAAPKTGPEPEQPQPASSAPPEANIPADTMAAIRDGASKEERALVFWNVILTLKGTGLDPDAAVALMEQFPNGLARAYRGRLRDTVAQAFARVKQPETQQEDADADAGAMPKAGEMFDPWQPFIAPAFPIEILPNSARDFVAKLSDAIGVDPSAMAMATLAACSGAIHQRFSVKMRRNADWWEHVRLWVLLIGPPSAKKTPTVNEVSRPLERIQAKRMAAYGDELRLYKERTKARRKGDPEEDEPEPPERYSIQDTTTEKLAEILSRSERGSFAKLDEVAGWIGRMERYHTGGKGASADRAFWLQSWNGGPYSVDRVKSGETFIQNLSISILGGVQPQRLHEIHGLSSDGLAQRFIPVLMRAPTRGLDIDCSRERDAYDALIQDLIGLKPRGFVFTDTALETMEALYDHLSRIEQVGEALSEGFEGFVGKLTAYAGVLAMILHLIDNPLDAAKHSHIAGNAAEGADRLVRSFILPHAREFYSQGEGEGEKLRKLASFILTSGLKRLRLADLTTNVWDCRGLAVKALNDRISPLVAGGWLSPIDEDPRICRAWQVNREAIDAQFADRTRTEQERKQAIAELMGSPRRRQA